MARLGDVVAALDQHRAAAGRPAPPASAAASETPSIGRASSGGIVGAGEVEDRRREVGVGDRGLDTRARATTDGPADQQRDPDRLLVGTFLPRLIRCSPAITPWSVRKTSTVFVELAGRAQLRDDPRRRASSSARSAASPQR